MVVFGELRIAAAMGNIQSNKEGVSTSIVGYTIVLC